MIRNELTRLTELTLLRPTENQEEPEEEDEGMTLTNCIPTRMFVNLHTAFTHLQSSRVCDL